MRISDFALVEWHLRKVCSRSGSVFVDLPVTFGGEQVAVDGRGITVGETTKLSHTLFQIFSVYLSNLSAIGGGQLDDREKVAHMNSFLAVVRDLSYAQGVKNDGSLVKESVSSRLNRDAFVWIVLRDVVCPAFAVPPRNIKVVAARSPYVDVAKFIEEGDIEAQGMASGDYPFVYLNLEVENAPCRAAHLLFEGAKGQGIDAKSALHEVLSRPELRNKVLGLAKAAFVDDALVNNFAATLGILTDYERPDEVLTASVKGGKTAQVSPYNGGSWWMLGLLEKMMDPARGSDWSTYEALENYTSELWEKVEDEKKKRGLAELPMELLLRVQSRELKQQPDVILQSLLADERIW